MHAASSDPAGGARLFVMVGLPAAGKTTRAREIERRHRALRLTPDEWMIPLFGEPDAGGRRDVLEGRFVWLALASLRLGVNVVLDFGVWSKDERSALRALAASAGASSELVYLPIEEREQQRRVEARSGAASADTVALDEVDLRRFRQLFQPPDEPELTSRSIDPPPPGFDTWLAWAAMRWPTSVAEGERSGYGPTVVARSAREGGADHATTIGGPRAPAGEAGEQG
jgi:predicted kinase